MNLLGMLYFFETKNIRHKPEARDYSILMATQQANMTWISIGRTKPSMPPTESGGSRNCTRFAVKTPLLTMKSESTANNW